MEYTQKRINICLNNVLLTSTTYITAGTYFGAFDYFTPYLSSKIFFTFITMCKKIF